MERTDILLALEKEVTSEAKGGPSMLCEIGNRITVKTGNIRLCRDITCYGRCTPNVNFS